MPLNQYQKSILKTVREDENEVYGLKFISLTTGASYFSGYDAYRKQTWVETDTFFSGSVLWTPYSSKNSSEGGFYKLSNIVITCSRDNRTTAQKKDVQISCDSIKFRVDRVIDCENSNEIVIHASRLE